MAEKIEDRQRVTVKVSKAELSELMVEPAKQRGFIDFDPTRINIKQQNNGAFVIEFERVNK